MEAVFVDTVYWLAKARPHDPWYESACRAREHLEDVYFVTTDEVLSEVLTSMAKGGPYLRKLATAYVSRLMNDPSVEIVPQSRMSFTKGLDLYGKRVDKSYSRTDCISICTMRAMNLQRAITNDHHFEQEGFTILMNSHTR